MSAIFYLCFQLINLKINWPSPGIKALRGCILLRFHFFILFLTINFCIYDYYCLVVSRREALLAEMGVAIREDGGTLGVFSPKKVENAWHTHTNQCYVIIFLPHSDATSLSIFSSMTSSPLVSMGHHFLLDRPCLPSLVFPSIHCHSLFLSTFAIISLLYIFSLATTWHLMVVSLPRRFVESNQ